MVSAALEDDKFTTMILIFIKLLAQFIDQSYGTRIARLQAAGQTLWISTRLSV